MVKIDWTDSTVCLNLVDIFCDMFIETETKVLGTTLRGGAFSPYAGAAQRLEFL